MVGIKRIPFGGCQLNNLDDLNPVDHPHQFRPIRVFKFGRLYFKGGDDPELKDTEDQKELAKIASERWEDYQRDFVPAENFFIDEMINYDKDSRKNNIESAAVSNTESAYGDYQEEQLATLTENNVNPNSGAFGEAISDIAIDKGSSRTSNVVQSKQALQDLKVQGMKNVVAVGNGQAAESLAGLNTVASNSANQAINDVQTKAYESQSKFGAIGQAAGMAGRAALGSSEDDE